MFEPEYNIIYGSAIFSTSEKKIQQFKQNFPNAIVGGTGTNDNNTTVESVLNLSEYEYYDYDIYPDFDASVLISGCKRGSFSISGTIDGAGDGEYLLLKEVKPGILEPVDSVVPGKDGRFSFRSETGWPAFFMLSMDDDDFLT